MKTSPQEKNRLRLRELSAQIGSYQATADLVAQHTMRPVSVDSIKSWSTGRRDCPDWIVKVLEDLVRTVGRA